VNNKGVIGAYGGTSTFTVRFGAVFHNYSSNEEYQLEISDDDIFIESIDELRLEVGSTLSGKKGVTSSQLYLGATFTDGRKYKKLFSNIGVPELPGLVSFVSQAPLKASVDAASGTVTLQDNHHSEVLVEALAYGKVFSTIGVYCNLLPIDLGDVDLGETVGVPLSSPVVGTTFATAVRVNGGSRGSRAISGYNIQLQYDPEFLEVVAVENSIPSSKGTAELRYSVSTDATSVSIVATVQDSKVSGVAQIANIRFRAKAAGETVITGIVEELVDNTPINPLAIGAQPALFESGTVPILIRDGGKRTARTLFSSS
jgi:hypothetical protein